MLFKKKIKKYKNSLLILALFLLQINFSFAQNALKFKELSENLTGNVLITLATLFMTAAFMLFFYGVAVFIYGRVTNKGDLKNLEQGKQFMLWGLIALFVMVSVWGIIKLAQELLGIKGGDMNIQPVRIIMKTPPEGETPAPDLGIGGGGGNDSNNGGSSGGSGSFAKEEGETCTVLPGTESECKAGMYCLGSDGKALAVGAKGVCAKQNANTTTFTPGQDFPGLNSEERKKVGQDLVLVLKNHNCIPIHFNVNNLGEKYTSELASYVKAFQKSAGEAPTGSFKKDDNTWKALSDTGYKCKTCGITIGNCAIKEICSSQTEGLLGICLPK